MTKPALVPAKKRGGPRPRAGRPKGTKGKRISRDLRRKILATEAMDKAIDGASPVDVMLHRMRRHYGRALVFDQDAEKLANGEQVAMITQASEELKLAHEAARDAAPYCHPRLAALAVQEQPSEPSRLGRFTRDELIDLMVEARERERARIGKKPQILEARVVEDTVVQE